MRVLFTTQPAEGHFHPLVPLAQALRVAGHEVAFAGARSFCPTIEASGFRPFPAGLDWLAAEFEQTFPYAQQLPPRRTIADIFAGVTAGQMVLDLLALMSNWRPDVIVRDPLEFGGCVAAEYLGLPHATSGASAFGYPKGWRKALGAPLDKLRRAHSLPPDPDLTMLYR